MSVEYKNHLWEMVITGAEGAPESETDSKEVLRVVAAASDWRALFGMKAFNAVAVGDGEYSWRLEHDDGRIFAASLFLGASSGASAFTHAVVDRWTLIETGKTYLELRDAIVELLLAFDIAQVAIEWFPEEVP